MIYLYSIVISFLSSLRLPTQLLWTLVCLMLGFSWMDSSQGWGVYHYYVNGKYFSELGYFDLYECTIDKATPRRDLYTYQYRLDQPTCTADFTPERWQEFRQDIKDSGYYPQAMIDKGYNGTPTWTAIFGTLANWNIITPTSAPLVDIIALVSALFFCVWSVGWRKSAYIALIVLSFYGTLDRVWGHYAQWVWLAAALVGVCLLERRKAAGSLFIAFSTSIAIFPVFLMLRYRSTQGWILFAVGLMTFGTIGLANGRSLDGYLGFAHNMSIHSSYLRSELCCNVGLSHSLSFAQNPTDQYLMCFIEWDKNCPTSYDNQFNVLYWLVLVPLVLTSPLGVMFGLLTLSVYYFLVLAVIPIWYEERWTRWLLLINAIAPLALILNWELLPYQNWVYFVYFVALGVTHVNFIQTAQAVMGAIKQGLHPTVTTGDVSQ